MINEKRFEELYNRAFEHSYVTYSEFLNLEEQSILHSACLPCVKYGGYPQAERIIAAFGENPNTLNFPISVLEISPANKKFADMLTHRDFLGALMSLGIKRELIGDIIVSDNTGYVFCLIKIKDYIKENLTRMKRTTVRISEIESLPANILTEHETRELIVSSIRIDAVICAVYKLSRSNAAELFAKEKVFVNSRKETNISYKLKENDIISVRGFGRFIFSGEIRTTKKDRQVIQIQIYK